MRHIPLSLAIACAIAVPALAEPPAVQQVNVEGQRPLGPPRNASQVVCRRQLATGSRLRSQRVCASRQQWADQRATDRQLVEKAQTNRAWPGEE